MLSKCVVPFCVPVFWKWCWSHHYRIWGTPRGCLCLSVPAWSASSDCCKTSCLQRGQGTGLSGVKRYSCLIQNVHKVQIQQSCDVENMKLLDDNNDCEATKISQLFSTPGSICSKNTQQHYWAKQHKKWHFNMISPNQNTKLMGNCYNPSNQDGGSVTLSFILSKAVQIWEGVLLWSSI